MFGNQAFDLKSEYVEQNEEQKLVTKTDDQKSVLP